MKAKNRTNTGLISNWNLETYFGFWGVHVLSKVRH